MVRCATAHRLIVMDQWRLVIIGVGALHAYHSGFEVFRHAERWLKLHFNQIPIDFARWTRTFFYQLPHKMRLFHTKYREAKPLEPWMHSKCTDIYLSSTFILAVVNGTKKRDQMSSLGQWQSIRMLLIRLMMSSSSVWSVSACLKRLHLLGIIERKPYSCVCVRVCCAHFSIVGNFVAFLAFGKSAIIKKWIGVINTVNAADRFYQLCADCRPDACM